MNEPRWDHLIQAHLDDALTAAEHAELEALLIESASARRRFWELGEVHGLAREAARLAWAEEPAAESPVPFPARGKFVWFRWRPLSAVAAGIVFGMLGASMVWAYAVQQRQVTVLHEGFESSPAIARQNFPETTGQWAVVGGSIVGAENGVAPKEGRRMLRLGSKLREKSTRAFYAVDLRNFPQLTTGTKQQFEFRAAFRPEIVGQSDRYILRAAAFAEDLPAIDRRWMLDLWGEVQDHSLASAARSLGVSPGTGDWKTLSLTIDVPPGARILVLSVWTATMDDQPENRSAHYVDDIRLSCITREPLP